MIEDCKKEIIGLHLFFEQWFKAEIENTEKTFSRLDNALNPNFQLIMPTGDLSSREQIIYQIKTSYASHKNDNTPYRLWVKNVQHRLTIGDVCLMTYEEWAEVHGKVNARLSSALFKKNSNTINNVEWIHVHEVFIPIE